MRSAFEKDIERFYKAFRLIVELINKMQDKEKVDEVFEMCIKIHRKKNQLIRVN